MGWALMPSRVSPLEENEKFSIENDTGHLNQEGDYY